MTTTTTNRFRVKGINDDRDTCECCGKTGLKRVVWIEDTETLEVRHFGTSCAANPKKAFGLGREIKKAVRDWEKEVTRRRREAYAEITTAACKQADATYAGEWVTKEFSPRLQASLGRKTYTVPVDQAAYDAHKKAIVDAAIARFNA